MNGNYTLLAEIEVANELPTQPRRFTTVDEDLLDKIANGDVVVLPVTDLRIKYRITDEECKLILGIREGDYAVNRKN